MKKGTIKHPKVERLMAELAINRREAVGLLQLLWEWAGDYAAQGDVGRWPDAAIANAVEWPVMEHNRLVRALINSGWIDNCAVNRLVIHDWEDHCEEYIKKRLKRQGLAFAVISPVSGQCLDNGCLPGLARPLPSQARPKDPAKPPAIGWTPDGNFAGITAKDREGWSQAFPACNIDRQLAAMHEWLLANPEKKKIRWRRFITNWLGRSQERGGDIGHAGRQLAHRPPKPAGDVVWDADLNEWRPRRTKAQAEAMLISLDGEPA